MINHIQGKSLSESFYGAGKGGGGGLLGGLGRSRGGMFRNSGVGSHSRGATFKNMIVGAAAGFLAYKAGKAIIRNVARPMMWNNRPYYWGSQYYPHQQYGGGGYGAGGGAYPGANSRTMCRMPIDPSDPVLGQVYLEDNTRPKEIAWSCNYNEECCGYECCPQQSQYQQQSPQYPPQSHHSQPSQYSSSESHSQETQYPPPQSQY